VAICPSSGEVLALANAEANEGQNLAAVGQFPPGSTFKVVTALALLRSGLAVDDVVSCPETTTVDGREFKNYDAYPSDKLGEIPFTVAFAESCNTALIDLREEISPDDLVDAAQSLGLGLDLADDPLGYPAFLGSVPEPEEGTEYAASLIGQGRTLASPLAMATVAASVQAGETVIPTLIDGLSPSTEPPTPLTETEAQTLRDLMGAVVSEGTGRLLADLPGEEVLAKTGTAEHGDAELPPHTWMVGIQGDLAVGVFVEHGIGGAETRGPLLRDFLGRAAELCCASAPAPCFAARGSFRPPAGRFLLHAPWRLACNSRSRSTPRTRAGFHCSGRRRSATPTPGRPGTTCSPPRARSRPGTAISRRSGFPRTSTTSHPRSRILGATGLGSSSSACRRSRR